MFVKRQHIPSPEEIRAELPLPVKLTSLKEERDELVKDVLAGRSNRFLVVVGPCSAHESAPVLEYVRRLGKLNERVKEKLVLVPRVYTNKPRTKGVGYKGMFSQPDPENKEDIARGIRMLRRLHIRVMDESGLTAADEMLYPENFPYVEDIVTYSTVGARSSENQLHRLVASGIDSPVGIKNPMSGSIPVLLNSIYAAQCPQVFKYGEWQVETDGNPYAHAILRGRVDNDGKDSSNYDIETVLRLKEGYKGLRFPAVVIDTNHSNSGKDFKKQIQIAEEFLKTRAENEDYRSIVKGLMIESFLVEGRQDHDVVFGQSITDPCLGWEDTERLILEIAEKV